MKKLIALLLMLALLPALPALALEPTPEEIWAEQRMLEVDPDAADAANIFVCPSNESEGAWVFCCTKHHLISSGEFWYLTEDAAYSLGKGKHFDNWALLRTTPEVFCCSIEKPDRRYANASILVDGKPYALNGTQKFESLSAYSGCMYGRIDGYDYAFLCVDGNELCEVEATEITMEQFMTLNGAQDVLDALRKQAPEVRVDSLLYRATGVVTLNVSGKANETEGSFHVYAWPSEDGGVKVRLSFGDQLPLHDGAGSPTRSTGLRAIGSVFPE